MSQIKRGRRIAIAAASSLSLAIALEYAPLSTSAAPFAGNPPVEQTAETAQFTLDRTLRGHTGQVNAIAVSGALAKIKPKYSLVVCQV